jgi:hypothetical protein
MTSTSATTTLRVGAARTNITPPLGSHLAGSLGDRLAEDVLDELYAKAVVVESDGTTAAWAVVDLIAMERAELDQAKAIASQATGIPVRRMMIACTHTHYAPMALPTMFGCPRNEDYVPWAVRKIADSIILAHRRLRPARMGHASTQCGEEVFNRRFRMKDGSVRMNPGHLNPDIVETVGPTDPEIVVMAFETPDGKPIAVLANYALHYVGGPYGESISADYFGAFERHLQQCAGNSGFVGVMINGCFGDINNIDVSQPAPAYPYPFAKADAVAKRVASRVWQAWRAIDRWDTAPRLSVVTDEFVFRRRALSADDLADARRIIDDAASAEIDVKYALEALAVNRLPLEQPTILGACILGDVGFVTMPGEMFCQAGLDLKAAAPTKRTVIMGLGNDWLGYIPPAGAFEQGGYELRTARSAKAARGMSEAIIDAAAALLRRA